jgi:hypothetical protein
VIYFAQPTDGGPIKIGCTEDVSRRLKQLESHYGCPLALLKVIPGDFEEEKAIHERFLHLRLGKTEQFQPASDLMAFLGRPLLVDPNPDAVEALEPAFSEDRKNAIVALKCRANWREWLFNLADKRRIRPAQLIDIALANFAKIEGEEIPPRR